MIEKNDLRSKLQEIDDFKLVNNIPDDILDKRLSRFSKEHIKQESKAILGLDIYKYSEFDEDRQPLIPFVFDLLFDGGIFYIQEAESTLFKGIDIRKDFISTGDGGFIIFPTPIHALIFNLYFFAALHIFNSGHFFPKLSNYMGEITIRSAITYDNVFNYEKNWYGKAIIKNSRILSKDQLNRFTIDKETYNYFMRNFNGIETLSIIDRQVFKKSMGIDGDFHSVLFDGRHKNLLRNIHIQKLEDILAKNTKLNIYNLEIQFNAISTLNNTEVSYIFTLGNTNTVK